MARFEEDPPVRPTLADMIARRLTRRQAMKGMGAAAAFAAAGGLPSWPAASREAPPRLTFKEIAHGLDEEAHVPPGYSQEVLIRWGDPVVDGAPAFDIGNQSAAAQARQFGYNNDYIGFLPLPFGSDNASRGLLCVNHEFTIGPLMFPGYATGIAFLAQSSAEEVAIEMAAHGMSIVEVRHAPSGWHTMADSPFNRRISPLDTVMRISGPAAGHARLRTREDAAGRTVVGMLNNCAGGTTPWGTVLTCEENVNFYFGGRAAGRERDNHARMGIGFGNNRFGWHRYHERFDVAAEPNEPNRFGWVVEIDPFNPGAPPVKRTALGRFKHEGATTVVNRDGRVVVYSGDDARFEYLYKFVTARPYDADNRAGNADLLDQGTLYVARFEADGRLIWLPLEWGRGPLTPENGFDSPADVMIETRRAGDLLGATPMDRPEDVETNPATGRVYMMLTNNTRRGLDEVDAANPRPYNMWGHVIEIVPPGDGADSDHATTESRWSIFLLAGDPADASEGALYHPAVSENGWLSCPDNCAFDAAGRLWLATDGAPGTVGFADGLYACATTGPERALTKLFFRAPTGAEVCGPCFTPDGTTLFLAVQHPGADDGSTFAHPSTRWPDFTPGVPPRPAVVAITRRDGRPIGS